MTTDTEAGGYHVAARGGSPDERGAVAAFVVLIMVGLVALLGLVVDGGVALTARQAAHVEAEQAARAGAGALSKDALRAGLIEIDGPAAVVAAEAFMAAAGHPGSATVAGGVVTVWIKYQVPTTILGIIGIDRLDVSAEATALNVGGVTRGSP
jgi:Flp pilus assembly protein TadG